MKKSVPAHEPFPERQKLSLNFLTIFFYVTLNKFISMDHFTF